MNFKILTENFIVSYTKAVAVPPLDSIEKVVGLLQFYKSVSSVYSSKIEGEEIDFDSYFKHKFLNVKFKPDYTRKADDLYLAYDFIEANPLTFENVQKAHSILSRNLLPKSQQGVIRSNPMFIINNENKIEYVAPDPRMVKEELGKLFYDIEILLAKELNPFEVLYFASLIHLVFVNIHPFQDGNGRAARLLEKWFLAELLGEKAWYLQSELYYYQNVDNYYKNLNKLGVFYEQLDYKEALPFLLMLPSALTVSNE